MCYRSTNLEVIHQVNFLYDDAMHAFQCNFLPETCFPSTVATFSIKLLWQEEEIKTLSLAFNTILLVPLIREEEEENKKQNIKQLKENPIIR